jgi:hypothetical protein
VGGGILRLPVFKADEAGLAEYELDFGTSPASQLTTGSTWNFQHWYRNPGGPCGNQFNLSNAISVTFED